MAASSDSGTSRKRVATYGKAFRKRLPDHIAFNNFQELKSIQTGSRVSLVSPIAADTPGSKLSSSASPSPFANEDMFDVPSSDEEARMTIQKRRKLLRPAPALKAQPAKDSLDTSRSISRQDIHRAAVAASRDATLKHHKEQQLPPDPLQQDSPQAKSYVLEGRPIESSNNKFINSDASFPPKPRDLVKSPTKHYSRPFADLAGMGMQSPNTTPFTTPQPRRSPSSMRQEFLVTAFEKCASTPDSLLATNGEHSRTTLFRPTPAVLTPRGMKMWQGLLGDDNREDLDPTMSEMFAEQIHQQREDSKNRAHNRKLPRKRLIDSLVEQSKKSQPLLDLESESEPGIPQGGILALEDLECQDQQYPATQVTSVPIGSANASAMGLPASAAQTLQSSVTKITYSRQRSILAEQNHIEEISFDVPLIEGMSNRTTQKRRGSIPLLVSLQNLHEKSQVDDANAGVAIRTIHELRHAGAQTRFKDEVEDLFERIGTPKQQKSVRRSGLMDLARKMRDKVFISDFLSNGMDHRLFVHLGQEQDVIAGFILLSLLITVLDNGITSVPTSQLRQQGVSRLLIWLMGIEDSIVSITKDRKTNMSKSAQLLFSELHQNLLSLKVWDDMRPQSISPRTASLRCLELMSRQSRETGNAEGLLSEELVGRLFALVKPSSDSRFEKTDAINFQLALTILESYSAFPVISATKYLPTMRDLLKAQLRNNSNSSTVALLLRLVLNITNNSSAASDVFASPDVLHLICRVVIEKFKLLSESILEPERLVVVDHLVLMLVVMINILELSLHAPACFEGFKDNTLNDLVQIFLDNNEKAFEVFKFSGILT